MLTKPQTYGILNTLPFFHVMSEAMKHCGFELESEELEVVSGGGNVNDAVSEVETSATAFLKKFGEASVTFATFINTPATQIPTANVA